MGETKPPSCASPFFPPRPTPAAPPRRGTALVCPFAGGAADACEPLLPLLSDPLLVPCDPLESDEPLLLPLPLELSSLLPPFLPRRLLFPFPFPFVALDEDPPPPAKEERPLTRPLKNPPPPPPPPPPLPAASASFLRWRAMSRASCLRRAESGSALCPLVPFLPEGGFAPFASPAVFVRELSAEDWASPCAPYACTV